MAKIFQTLRRKLIKEGELKKYLIYALGEIVLIVLGILIALQISNTNTENLRDKQELTLLEQMRNNLMEDLTDAKGNVGWLTGIRNSNLWVLQGLNGDTPFGDTLRPHYARMYQTVRFSKNASAYKNLESIGLSLISNPVLRERVTNHYTILYDGISGISRLHANLLENQLLPEILDNVDVDLNYNNGEPEDYEALKNNRKLKRIIIYNCALMENMIGAYENVVQRVEELLEDLSIEIDSRSNDN